MTILIAGGAGYIGSHIAVELLDKGEEILIVDNFSNSSKNVINRIEKITKKEVNYVEIDIKDKAKLRELFLKNNIESVIHLAGYKSVNESIDKPLEYYENNIATTLSLCKVMREFNVKKLIFSSSATVYGNTENVPITEDTPKGVSTNPYGWTKWMIEQILTDLYYSDNSWNITILRYFNPVGAHKSGLIGEDPNGIPNNLSPYISQVAAGKMEYLKVFGNDYNTIDGTGVRDYIHVIDLALGHIAALYKLNQLQIFNLGTGKGSSVLQVLKSFEKAVGKKIPYRFVERRPGDVAISYCDNKKAKEVLKWSPKYELDEMCRDSWFWQKKNPNGYN